MASESNLLPTLDKVSEGAIRLYNVERKRLRELLLKLLFSQDCKAPKNLVLGKHPAASDHSLLSLHLGLW
jgi:hypothetical protein